MKKIAPNAIKNHALVNVNALKSPLSLLYIKKTIEHLKSGEIVRIESMEPQIAEDLESWCTHSDNIYLGEKFSTEGSCYFIQKK